MSPHYLISVFSCWQVFLFTLCKATHVQRNDTCPTVVPRICAALSSDWLKVDFWIQGPVAADTSHSGMIFDQSDARRHPVSWILIGRKSFHCAMYLLPLDLVSKNQLSTNQNLFNTRKFAKWPSDMCHSVGHVSPCIVCFWCKGISFQF